MKTYRSKNTVRHLTATAILVLCSLTVWFLVSRSAISQEKTRRPENAKAPSLVQIVREEGPKHVGKKYNTTAIRYSHGSETTYGILFPEPGTMGLNHYEMSLETAVEFRKVLSHFVDAEKPAPTMITETKLTLSFTTLKGNAGHFDWLIMDSEEGYQEDVTQAKEIVKLIDQALKDIEAMKAIRPSYSIAR